MLKHDGFLMNKADSVFFRILGRADMELLPIDQNLSLRLFKDTAQNVHQSRLSGAVYADQADNLSALRLNVYFIKRFHAWKYLRSSAWAAA